MDITDEKAFDNVFSKHPKIDSVIHFAALKVRIFYTASYALLTNTSLLFLGRRRVLRNPPRVLPRQCLWHNLSPQVNDPSQRHQYCLLLLRDRLW